MMHCFQDLYGPLFSLPVSKYEIRFTYEQGVSLGGMESRVRGRLGYHLKRLCCAFTDFTGAVCEQCTLAENCRYPELFGVKAGPAEIDKNGRFRQTPTPAQPYVVALDEILSPEREKKAPGGVLTLTLFVRQAGRVRLFVEAAMAALISLSFSIEDTGVILPPHLSPSPGADDIAQGIPLHEWLSCDGALFSNGASGLGLRFITPVRLTKDEHPVRGKISFLMVAQAVLRRLRDLKRAFGEDDDMGKAGKAFFETAKSIKISENKLRWTKCQRWSHRQKQSVLLNGFTGEIRFKGPVAPYYPLIKAGEIIHIGKSTSNGNGRVKVV